MVDKKEDTGVIEALLHRLKEYRLPRMIELKERVATGEAIGDADIEFLERVLKDAQSAHALVDRHPEVQSLATKLTAMYQEIVDQALENEKRNPDK